MTLLSTRNIDAPGGQILFPMKVETSLSTVDGLAESEASSQPVHHAKARQSVCSYAPGKNDLRGEITRPPANPLPDTHVSGQFFEPLVKF
jgi:hypothetical protein